MASKAPPKVSQAYYICGQYYPRPKADREITADNAHRDIPKSELDRISGSIIGKPITVDHPIGIDGVPLPSEKWKSTVRGKCVWSGQLNDGAYYFVAEMPLVKGNVKTYMTKGAIENGELQGVSLGNRCSVMFNNSDSNQYFATYKSDHIALLPDGKQEHKTCKLMSATSPVHPIEHSTDNFISKERYRKVAETLTRKFQENSREKRQLHSGTAAFANLRENRNASSSSASNKMNFVEMPQESSTTSSQPATGGASQASSSSSSSTQYNDQQQQAQQPQQPQQAQQQQSQQQQQQQNGGEQMSDDPASDPNSDKFDPSKMSRDELEYCLQSISQAHANLQNQTSQIMQSAVDAKRQQLHEQLQKIGERLYHMQTSQMDNQDLTEDNKKKIAQKVKEFIKTQYKMPDMNKTDAHSLQKELDTMLHSAKGWGNTLEIMANSSAEGAEFNRQALIEKRRSSMQSRYEYLTGGVRSMNMKPNSQPSVCSPSGVKREMTGNGWEPPSSSSSSSSSSSVPPISGTNVTPEQIIQAYTSRTGTQFRNKFLPTKSAEQMEKQALEFQNAKRLANGPCNLSNF